MLNNHILKKVALTIVILLFVLFILNTLKIIIVGSIWFIVLCSILGIILPTLIWTSFKKGKDKYLDGRK